MAETTDAGDEHAYSGLLGAFGYAFRASDSLAFRLYVVLSALLGLGVTALLALALVVWIANPVGLIGERAFLGVIALVLLVPLFAPVLLVARHSRRDGVDARYDALLALAGFAFVLSLYVGLVITVPPSERATPTGSLAPVIEFLYGLPPTWGFAPPVVGVALIVLAHRFAR